MELRDLRSFLAVAQHRNVSRAAEALHVSQPALSEQIRKLEDELGAPLFDRTSRGVSLTDAGEALLPHARTVLAQADAAADSVRTVARGLAGTLTLGFIDSAALTIVPPIVRRFSDRHPDVGLRLRELSTRQQIEAVAAGEIDIGIVRGPVWDERLEGRLVATESLLVAFPARHRLAASEVIQVEDLREDGFIMYPAARGTGLAEETKRLCHAAGFDPRVVQEANEIATICAMVAAGLGVAIVPSSAATIHLEGVVYRPLDDGDATIERWAVWREAAPISVVRAFIATLEVTPIVS
jgi:DNA-binding transcriptional LysR family regulator